MTIQRKTTAPSAPDAYTAQNRGGIAPNGQDNRQIGEKFLERAAGIEPASLAWKAKVLPLHNARSTVSGTISSLSGRQVELIKDIIPSTTKFRAPVAPLFSTNELRLSPNENGSFRFLSQGISPRLRSKSRPRKGPPSYGRLEPRQPDPSA